MHRHLVVLATALQLCQAQNILSGASLFIGGKSPVISTSYGQFQGKNDDRTGTSNYLGVPYASAPRFDHSVVADQPFSGVQGKRPPSKSHFSAAPSGVMADVLL